MSLGAQSLVITVDSTSGFSYEVSARARVRGHAAQTSDTARWQVKFPKEAPIFTEYECTHTQTNS